MRFVHPAHHTRHTRHTRHLVFPAFALLAALTITGCGAGATGQSWGPLDQGEPLQANQTQEQPSGPAGSTVVLGEDKSAAGSASSEGGLSQHAAEQSVEQPAQEQRADEQLTAEPEPVGAQLPSGQPGPQQEAEESTGGATDSGVDIGAINGDNLVPNYDQEKVVIPGQPRLRVTAVSFQRPSPGVYNDCTIRVVLRNEGSAAAEGVHVYANTRELVAEGALYWGGDLEGPVAIAAGDEAVYRNDGWTMAVQQGFPVLHEVTVDLGGEVVASDVSPFGTVAQPCE